MAGTPRGPSAPHNRDYVRHMTAIRLLLVDDDPLVRAGLSFMMGGAGDIELVGEGVDGAEARRSSTAPGRTWS